MDPELLEKIASLVKRHNWSCDVLVDKKEINPNDLAICQDMKANIILPAESRICVDYEPATVVFELDSVNLEKCSLHARHAILRIKRNYISYLAETAKEILRRFSRVSFVHPELLYYEEQDFATYKKQLLEISKFILSVEDWCSRYDLNCLTGGFFTSAPQECGAGINKVAIGPSGGLYYCPAAERNKQVPFGHILEKWSVPNRHLFSRNYSVPCGRCEASHCMRCVHLNKSKTYEFCVPCKNMCLLSNHELEVQAWLSQEAIKLKRWPAGFSIVDPPLVYDPYQLVTLEKELPPNQAWRRLVKWTGDPGKLSSAMMLDIIHHLQGWCKAMTACAQTGILPTTNLLGNDSLSSLRRKAIEKYREVIFQKDFPTVRQIELLMARMAEEVINTSQGTSL